MRYNWVSPQDYLDAERLSEEKHEYFDGEVIVRLPDTAEHETILVNIVKLIRAKTRNTDFRVRAYGLKTGLPSSKAFLYPDVIVVNGLPQHADENLDVLQNPTVIIEIVSENSMGEDYGRKRGFYMEIPTLAEYVLVHSSEKMLVDLFTRNRDNTWTLKLLAGPPEHLVLQSVGISISLGDIYENVIFEPYEEPEGLI